MTDPIRFLLNGMPVKIEARPPTETLLNWLRYERRLTGTKEGCAEGDCGACTVGLRRLGPAGLETRPACACILTLGMVHGAEVVTVEGLAAPDGRLHPVQRALAEGHGAQCGFCTPGFVMSLWCGYRTGAGTRRAEVAEQLAGNLCRCTGYGPILAAAGAARALEAPDWEATDAATAERLAALEAAGSLAYEAAGRHFWAPVEIDELARLIAEHPGATILSGATDIGLWITKQGFDPDKVIFTGRVRELAEIRQDRDALWIGAGATYTDARAPIGAPYPEIGALIDRIGGAQVRALGTIGGNIANGSPIGDMAPALIAAGARLVLARGPEVSRREIALEDFFIEYGKQDLRPGEFVEGVRVPLPEQVGRLACYKLSKRRDQDISSVLGCFDVAVADGRVTAARLAFGGMAGIPARARAAEAALVGQPWEAAAVAKAAAALAEDYSPLTDHRGSAGYRMRVARALLNRYFIERADSAMPTRLEALA